NLRSVTSILIGSENTPNFSLTATACIYLAPSGITKSPSNTPPLSFGLEPSVVYNILTSSAVAFNSIYLFPSLSYGLCLIFTSRVQSTGQPVGCFSLLSTQRKDNFNSLVVKLLKSSILREEVVASCPIS